MEIPVKNKSKAKKVTVNVVKTEEEDKIPTPPEDYKANTEEDIWNDPIEEPFVDDIYDTEYLDDEDEDNEEENAKEWAMRQAARKLAEFEPKDMRKVIRTARNLQKLVKPYKTEDESYKGIFDRIQKEDHGWV